MFLPHAHAHPLLYDAYFYVHCLHKTTYLPYYQQDSIWKQNKLPPPHYDEYGTNEEGVCVEAKAKVLPHLVY